MITLVKNVLTGKKSIRIVDNVPAKETPSQMMDRAFAAHRARTDAMFNRPLFK